MTLGRRRLRYLRAPSIWCVSGPSKRQSWSTFAAAAEGAFGVAVFDHADEGLGEESLRIAAKHGDPGDGWNLLFARAQRESPCFEHFDSSSAGAHTTHVPFQERWIEVVHGCFGDGPGIEHGLALVVLQLLRFERAQLAGGIANAKIDVAAHILMDGFARFDFDDDELAGWTFRRDAGKDAVVMANGRDGEVRGGATPGVLVTGGHAFDDARISDADDDNTAFGIGHADHHISNVARLDLAALAFQPLVFRAGGQQGRTVLVWKELQLGDREDGRRGHPLSLAGALKNLNAIAE